MMCNDQTQRQGKTPTTRVYIVACNSIHVIGFILPRLKTVNIEHIDVKNIRFFLTIKYLNSCTSLPHGEERVVDAQCY